MSRAAAIGATAHAQQYATSNAHGHADVVRSKERQPAGLVVAQAQGTKAAKIATVASRR
jgi:hypothetical protein